MAAIDEEIVREYFEQNGFFVRQGRKYQVQARRKTGGEEIDLLVFNPAWRRGLRQPGFLLFSSELPFLHRAIVSVRGWHTDVFTPAMLKNSPEIFRFVEDGVLKEASRLFPEEAEADALFEAGRFQHAVDLDDATLAEMARNGQALAEMATDLEERIAGGGPARSYFNQPGLGFGSDRLSVLELCQTLEKHRKDAASVAMSALTQAPDRRPDGE